MGQVNRARLVVLTTIALLSSVWAQQRPAVPRAQTQNPHGTLAQSCENCHTFTTWKPIRNLPEFSHDKTRYPLRGMHANVTCTQCHTKLLFTNVGHTCSDCHADIHRGQMGANCQNCHSVKGWSVSTRQIQQHQNRFPLVGAHAVLECEACHKQAAQGRFTGLSTDCFTCHAKDFRTTAFDHTGFPVTCNSCHRMDSWFGASFDHAKFTGFALTGMHATIDCRSCHVNGFTKGTPVTCYGCHAKEYNGTTNPNHVQASFPRDCSVCHTTATWNAAKFDHAAFTGFALTGMHAGLQCVQCHVGGKYTGTAADCASCHTKDFNATTNPNHRTSGFPMDCSICHTTNGWRSSSFDHSKVGFALTGAHASASCASCHTSGYTGGAPKTCYGCHSKDYSGATNPNHSQAGFPQDCTVCHTTSSWSGAKFDHAAYTGFALTGMHSGLQCIQCHVGGKYAGTSADCASCHTKDYNATTNPNHKTSGFPMDCSICHTTKSWSPASFDHSKSAFPLTGAHANVACASCHVNGQFSGLSTTCSSCHMKNFNSTTNPNHVQAKFPTDCQVCHSTTAWQPASFDHSKTGFPLTGAHVNVACASCHINGVYAGTPTDCYSCHKKDYTGTTNPNHVASGFPTTCNTCHTTTTWAGATFNHTWFPIYSGKHAGKWTTCADCHVNTANYAVFSCITCHQHDSSVVTPKHRDVRNFVYSATSCYGCHPTGRGD